MIVMTCPQCGKHFGMSNRGEYIYKLNHQKKKLVFCGYNCMTAFQKEHGVRQYSRRMRT